MATFLLFVHERQNIWQRKYEGSATLTMNPVFAEMWFTNVYRELDRGTQYFRKNIMETIMSERKNSNVIDVEIIEKVLFKSIIYRLINEIKTFQAFGGIPNPDNLPSFIQFLEACHGKHGSKVFTAAHQNIGLRRLLETFKFVQENLKQLVRSVTENANKGTLRGVFHVLLSIPNVGDFFSYQITCDLLEAKVLGKKISDDQWTCLGPGAKNGLKKLFGHERISSKKEELKLSRIVRDLCDTNGGGSGFEALNINFPTLLNKPLSLKNVEHSLCEYDKYYRAVTEDQARGRLFTEKSSNINQDHQAKCKLCNKVGSFAERVKCVLCGSLVHKHCDEDFEKRYVGTAWLCESCEMFNDIQ